jgi:uncharacterized protein YbjQ (UPF0145 family)
MLVSNLELVPGRRIVAHYGIVQGSTVRAKHVGKDIFAGLKNIVGGELKGYTELMQGAAGSQRSPRQSISANAILNVRSATSIAALPRKYLRMKRSPARRN